MAVMIRERAKFLSVFQWNRVCCLWSFPTNVFKSKIICLGLKVSFQLFLLLRIVRAVVKIWGGKTDGWI